jgi:hypothetical protein
MGAANTRCEEIQRAMPSLLELETNFEALQQRLWPLEQKGSGINGVLKELYPTLEIDLQPALLALSKMKGLVRGPH